MRKPSRLTNVHFKTKDAVQGHGFHLPNLNNLFMVVQLFQFSTTEAVCVDGSYVHAKNNEIGL